MQQSLGITLSATPASEIAGRETGKLPPNEGKQGLIETRDRAGPVVENWEQEGRKSVM